MGSRRFANIFFPLFFSLECLGEAKRRTKKGEPNKWVEKRTPDTTDRKCGGNEEKIWKKKI